MAGLRFVSADTLARELAVDARHAGATAEALRAELIHQRESFIMPAMCSKPKF